MFVSVSLSPTAGNVSLSRQLTLADARIASKRIRVIARTAIASTAVAVKAIDRNKMIDPANAIINI